jgi:hypothetical protein
MVAVNRNRVPERIMDDERGNDQHRHDPQQPGCDQGMTPVGRPKRRRTARDCGGPVSGGHKSVCQRIGCRVWSALHFHTFSPCPPACPAPPTLSTRRHSGAGSHFWVPLLILILILILISSPSCGLGARSRLRRFFAVFSGFLPPGQPLEAAQGPLPSVARKQPLHRYIR